MDSLMKLAILIVFLANFGTVIALSGESANAEDPSSTSSTQITGYADPSFEIHHLNSIVVYAPDIPLDNRPLVEAAVVEKLREIGIEAKRAIDVIPPTKDGNEEARNDFLRKSGLDAVLQLKTQQTTFSIEKHDSIVAPGATLRKLDPRTGNFVEYQTPPTILGGEIVQVPVGEFSITLSLIKDMNVIWTASVHATGNYKLGLGEVAFSSAIEELRKLHFL